MNLLAGLLLLAMGLFAIITWMSGNFLRSLAARLMTRAEALDAMHIAHQEGLPHWRDKLKVLERDGVVPSPVAASLRCGARKET